VILNGIEDIVTRPDLAERAVFLPLEPIPEERRRPEQELWAAFEAEHPAKGLAMLPQTKLEKAPRMADFALWATACETALWPAGTSGPRRVVDPDWRLNGRGHRQTLRSSPRRRLAAIAPI
jgi:hypothetical protein